MHPIAITKELSKLRQTRQITAETFTVAHTLLWRCRPKGADLAQVGYKRLAELAGVARSTAQEAVRRLVELGILVKRRTRLRVAWGHSVASRCWKNIYAWTEDWIAPAAVSEAPCTDTGRRAAVLQQQEKPASERSTGALAAILEAARGLPDLLKARREAMDARWRARYGIPTAG